MNIATRERREMAYVGLEAVLAHQHDDSYQWIRVDADGASNPSDIPAAEASTYTLTADDVGKKVKVKVSFTDDLNGEEERTSAAFPSSGTVTVGTTANTAPGAPTGLTATANGPSRIDLAWTAPASIGSSAITGYKIEVSPDGSSWSDLVADTRSTATTYADIGLNAATTRHYRVSAINAVGTSDPSDSDEATTEAAQVQAAVLVSNVGQSGADGFGLNVNELAQSFTTGDNDATYTLTSIELTLQTRCLAVLTLLR